MFYQSCDEITVVILVVEVEVMTCAASNVCKECVHSCLTACCSGVPMHTSEACANKQVSQDIGDVYMRKCDVGKS